MKVLITGIAGFIGSHVAEKFFQKEHKLLHIDDLSTGKYDNVRHIIKQPFIKRTICLHSDMEYVFERQPEIVIHLAAQPSLLMSQMYPAKDADINIFGTLKVLSLCQKYGVQFLVFASTSAVYHPELELPIDEDDETLPDSNYGTSKLAAENYIRNSGIPCAVLRFGNVYGPRQVPVGENQVIPRLLGKIYNGQDFSIYGDGEQVRDYVYVKDVAEAVYACAMGGRTGVFNVSTGIGTKTNDLVQMVLEETKTDFLNPLPHTEQRDDRNIVLSNRRIGKFWSPKTSLQEGLRETIKEWNSESSH